MRRYKALAVRGAGNGLAERGWQTAWTEALESSLSRIDPGARLEIEFLSYGDMFSDQEKAAFCTLDAVEKMVGSTLWHGTGDWSNRPVQRRANKQIAGTGDMPERIRYTAGMVACWAEKTKLRRRARVRLQRAIAEHNPGLVFAHSLGSLIAYDTFVQRDNNDLLADRVFVTFGSQLGNPFVRGHFAGRLVALNCRNWYHLYNPFDDIFTSAVRITADNFEQVDASFDIEGFEDRDAASYLSHANMSEVVWRDQHLTSRARRRSVTQRHTVRRRGDHKQRALLVGINEYPREDERLEGCVNDVFLMSSLLQKSGFDALDIRTVLDGRATADGIRSRLEWLLDGARAGDERVFYYSGHGAQITDYGLDETIDRRDECLVPVDFDWSRETAVTDDYFFELYSQLAYDTGLLLIFDCCHSGGMTRAGVGRPRGISPPDDIRHRELQWNERAGMWQLRAMATPNKSLYRGPGGRDYLGGDGTTRKLGTAVDLRRLTNAAFNRVRSRDRHFGPYLPVILQACQEKELAYEYRHGVTSYGAFTFSLEAQLRRAGDRGVSYKTVISRIATQLSDLGYEQTPKLVGPNRVTRRRIPF